MQMNISLIIEKIVLAAINLDQQFNWVIQCYFHWKMNLILKRIY